MTNNKLSPVMLSVICTMIDGYTLCHLSVRKLIGWKLLNETSSKCISCVINNHKCLWNMTSGNNIFTVCYFYAGVANFKMFSLSKNRKKLIHFWSHCKKVSISIFSFQKWSSSSVYILIYSPLLKSIQGNLTDYSPP